MQKNLYQRLLVISLLCFIIISACSQSQPPERLEVESNPDLAAHSAEFKQEVIKVLDGDYLAVGFGLANSVLLEGDDGVVIVDAMESAEAAIPVKEAFNKIAGPPSPPALFARILRDCLLVGAGRI